MGFAEQLDASVCEAYLWHGCTPQAALGIIQHGFQVGHTSKAGKRFGAGGYFAEDPSLSDKYAGPGDGVYSHCFAMLLCRVALGKQFIISQFRAEGATEEARAGGRHDSTLAEPIGASWREFVAFRTDQIYPEYAVVYERRIVDGSCTDLTFGDLDASRDDEDSQSTSTSDDEDGTTARPRYWLNRQHRGLFQNTHPANALGTTVQDLFDRAFLAPAQPSTCPASHLHLQRASGLRVLKVLRVEDSTLWELYRQARDGIRGKHRRRQATSSRTSFGDPPLAPPKLQSRLATDVNEAYLWYGSNPTMVSRITCGGFNASALHAEKCNNLGLGVPLAESPRRADDVSGDDRGGYYAGYFAALLCRAILGSVGSAEARRARPEEFDSWVDRAADGSVGDRVFMVPKGEQIYPEYAVLYERVFDARG